jgi:hypothetical protein
MSKELDFLKKQGLLSVSMSNDTGRYGNPDYPTRTVDIEVRNYYRSRRSYQHVAHHFRRLFCNAGEGCILLRNQKIRCSGMQNPGKVKRSSGATIFRGFSSAEINTIQPQSRNYWKTLSTRIPCTPEFKD